MTTDIATPLRLPNGQTLDNRIAKAAMSERIARADGAPNERHARLYERWGRGRAALLITGNVMVDGQALGESGNVVLQDEQHLAAFSAWSKAAHTGGARLWMQLNHPGRQSPRTLSRHPVAPSAVPVKLGGAFGMPRALRAEEIEDIVRRFARSAALAERASFDGVQIHGAHGYLVSQFLSPLTNLRDDAWGGDAERRRRFLLEVVRAVRKAVRTDFAVGVKLNSADFQRGGFSEHESMAVLDALTGEGVDLVEISGGTYESAAMFSETVPEHASSRAREAFFIDYAAKVRGRTTLPLMVTGGFRTLAGMNAALAEGATDVIGLARPVAVEPDLPRRLLAGEATQATPVKLATGVKALDALLQSAWYQAQISRAADGREPRPRLSRLRAVAGYFAPRRR